MRDQGRGGRVAIVLRWGFGAALLLATAAGVLSIVEVERARREVKQLVVTAERSTYLVGKIGRYVSRLRALAIEQVIQPERDDVVEDAELEAVAMGLDAAVRELEPLLQPSEIAAWRRATPVLAELRRDVDAVVGAVRRGSRPAAREALIERVTPTARHLQDFLDELGRLNAEASRAMLAAADRRLARTPVLEAVVLATLLAGIAGIWWAVRRRMDAQRVELERHVARIEASNRDLDAFAGRIAHDLRNALSPLGVAAAGLRQATGRPELVGRIADQISGTVQRSTVLMDGLLAFSRATGPTGGGESAQVRATVAAVLEELAPVVDAVDAETSVDVGDVEVRCAQGLFHIVVANLVGNALKFVDGRPVRRVTIAARTVGASCELVVADTGPGIPADAVGRIFEPFYRAPGAAAGGTGIGLATVQRIVEARGGGVTVESEAGRGATFRVRLPLRLRRIAAVPARTAV